MAPVPRRIKAGKVMPWAWAMFRSITSSKLDRRGSVRAPAAGREAGVGALHGGQVEEVRRLIAGRRLQRFRGVLHDLGAGGRGANSVAEDPDRAVVNRRGRVGV